MVAGIQIIWLQDYLKAEKRPSFLLDFFEKNKVALYVSVILYALLAIPISMVRESNEFFGERHNFYEDTIETIVDVSLYGKKYLAPDFDLFLIGLIAAVYLGIFIYGIRAVFSKKTEPLVNAAFSFWLLFSIFSLSTIVQFHLLDIPYLSERTALPYIPLFCVLPIFFLTFFKKQKYLQFALASLPIFAFSYHFSQCANIKEVKEWWFERDTLTALAYIEEHEDLPDIEVRNERPKFATGGVSAPAFHFHIIEGNLKKKLKPNRINVLSKNDLPDYYYVWFDDLKKIDEKKYDLLTKLKFGSLLKLKEEYRESEN